MKEPVDLTRDRPAFLFEVFSRDNYLYRKDGQIVFEFFMRCLFDAAPSTTAFAEDDSASGPTPN